MSDSEYESSLVQCELPKPKQVKEPVKRKASSVTKSTPSPRPKKKTTPANCFDVFNLQGGELPVDTKTAPASVLYNRVANGQTRRTAHINGSFYVELKVFNSADVDEGGDDLWKKSLLWLKVRTDDDTPHWDRLQKFVRQTSALFNDSEATFYSNNIKFK